MIKNRTHHQIKKKYLRRIMKLIQIQIMLKVVDQKKKKMTQKQNLH